MMLTCPILSQMEEVLEVLEDNCNRNVEDFGVHAASILPPILLTRVLESRVTGILNMHPLCLLDSCELESHPLLSPLSLFGCQVTAKVLSLYS